MTKARTLAIIPARGGSKRLPGKNVLELAGKPLIQWTLDAALRSGVIDTIIVSTDSESIREVVNVNQNFAPFIRPESLSGDYATSVDVVRHALDYVEQSGESFDYVVLLQPTSPLRRADHINEALRKFVEQPDTPLVSVCKVEHSPLWSAEMEDNGVLKFGTDGRYLGLASQQLPKFYRLNGAIYITGVSRFRREGSLFERSETRSYLMTQEDSVDIDTKLDFLLAEHLLIGALGESR